MRNDEWIMAKYALMHYQLSIFNYPLSTIPPLPPKQNPTFAKKA
jgi:hypothetical protein